MKVETVKVYKGSKAVTINKTDINEWRGYGFYTSSERQKKSKVKDDANDKA